MWMLCFGNEKLVLTAIIILKHYLDKVRGL